MAFLWPSLYPRHDGIALTAALVNSGGKGSNRRPLINPTHLLIHIERSGNSFSTSYKNTLTTSNTPLFIRSDLPDKMRYIGCMKKRKGKNPLR